MKLDGEMILIGLEERQGKKDPTKVYKMALFAQGTDTLDCTCSDAAFTVLQALPPYSLVHVCLDYNHTYKSIKLSEARQGKLANKATA